MANTGIRQLTTVVGGYAKRIWYSLNGTTPINELMSIDDAGKFKCASEQITGLAGTGNRMVVADSSGNLSAPTAISTDLSFTGRILSNVGYVGSGNNYNIKLSSGISTNGYLSGASLSESSYYSIAGTFKSETTTSARLALFGGDTIFYGDTGLTAGGTYIPTERFRVTPTGLKVASLAGTGSRMVVADSSGNLSASMQVETGTWTPVLQGSTSGVAVAGPINKGIYTKIGKLVMFSACVDWTSITGTITGSRIINGLPYANGANTPRASVESGLTITGSIVCNSNRTLKLMTELGCAHLYVGELDLQTGGAFTDTVTIGSSGTLYSVNGFYCID
jgi:hypothetical protein